MLTTLSLPIIIGLSLFSILIIIGIVRVIIKPSHGFWGFLGDLLLIDLLIDILLIIIEVLTD